MGSAAVNLLAHKTWWEKIPAILQTIWPYALFVWIFDILDHQADACWKSSALLKLCYFVAESNSKRRYIRSIILENGFSWPNDRYHCLLLVTNRPAIYIKSCITVRMRRRETFFLRIPGSSLGSLSSRLICPIIRSMLYVSIAKCRIKLLLEKWPLGKRSRPMSDLSSE
jgi:hypothetical protein